MPPFVSARDMAEINAIYDEGARTTPYELKRPGPKVPDGRGGWTAPETTPETGRCAIWPAGTQPAESAALSRQGWTSGYVVDFPLGSSAASTDDVVVGGFRLVLGAPIDEGIGALATGKRFVAQRRGPS